MSNGEEQKLCGFCGVTTNVITPLIQETINLTYTYRHTPVPGTVLDVGITKIEMFSAIKELKSVQLRDFQYVIFLFL